MDWSAKVELFEQIRREYEFGVGTVLGVAKRLGVHRRMVREALANAVPARRKRPERKRPKLGGVIAWIDAILEADARAPRKQRHTAHRIYQRMQVELPGHEVSESAVRRYVRQKKEALGLIRRETFVPQSYEWGSEAQADFYEAYADLRSLCRSERGAAEAVRVLVAQHGEWRGVSSSLPAPHAAGLSRSARIGLQVFWRSLPSCPL